MFILYIYIYSKIHAFSGVSSRFLDKSSPGVLFSSEGRCSNRFATNQEDTCQ